MVKQADVYVDVAIFGGGVAGLWTLNYLVDKGYNSLLVEKDFLGDGQTIVSQGMIHGGVKYALTSGMREDSVKEVSEMPSRWRQHLSGERTDPDLKGVRVASQSCYLWVSKAHGLRGRAEALLSEIGLKALNTKPRKLRRGQAPQWLEDSARVIYEVAEPMIDTRSLLEVLARPHANRILYSNQENMDIEYSLNPLKVHSISLDNVVINPDFVILAAGQGNKELAKQMGISEDIMQERPLRQVIVRGNMPEFYGHCIDHGRPDISITTHCIEQYELLWNNQYETLWNIGGKVAEDGPKMQPDELIEQARERVSKALQGLDFADTVWSTFDAVRAEAKARGERPSGVHVSKEGNVICGWPTKLALAPVLADEIRKMLPNPPPIRDTIPENITDGSIRIAKPPWAYR